MFIILNVLRFSGSLVASLPIGKIFLLHLYVLFNNFSILSSGVSRISFRGGFKIFLKKWGYLHGAKRHAARGEATHLLGVFGAIGGMLPEKIFKNGAIWCVLPCIRDRARVRES